MWSFFRKLLYKKIRIVLTGGGTGGHIFPLLAVAEQLVQLEQEKPINLEIFYIGPMKGAFAFDTKTFEQSRIKIVPIVAESPNNTDNPLRKALSLLKSFIGTVQCLWYLWLIMPDAVFSKGGYGALPVVAVGFLYQIPVIIHESDVLPGKINEVSQRFATRIAISFEGTARFFPLEKTALIGNPIRRSFFEAADKETAYAQFGFKKNLPVIFILGGSQGAKKLNDMILNVLPFLLEKYQLIHQVGNRNLQEVFDESALTLKDFTPELRERYKLFGFLNEDEMELAYELSDLIISRAGSGSIFEIAAKGKPSILIPLSTAARDHQRENAYSFAANGAAVVLEEGNLKSHILLETVGMLLGDKTRLKQMQQASREFAKPQAAYTVARELLRLADVRV